MSTACLQNRSPTTEKEYDDWWNRQGRYDQGPEFLAWWKTEIEQVESWLGEQAPVGRVLEIAAGTGNITRMIKPHAERIVAVDSSPETLAINKSKNGTTKVDYEVANVFEWNAEERFDTIAFGFWLSHVPESKLEMFWRRVEGWLKPSGRALFIDNRSPDDDWADKPRKQTDARHDPKRGISQRVLENGRSFEIVKIFREPEGLTSRLDAIGWHSAVNLTSGAFIYGTAAQHSRTSKT